MRWYRLLLRLYPAGFRLSYGDEMCAVFEEKRRRVRGPLDLAALWGEVGLDLVRHAVPLHLEALRQDVRYTGRSLFRVPGFAITVVLVSALGIGANTAVFTVVDRVLIRPLPFPSSDDLVRIWESPPGYSRTEASPPNYLDWKTMATSFSDMAAYNTGSVNIVGPGEPERIEGADVTGGVFGLLGVPPLLGRPIRPGDDVDGAPRAVVLSYRLWQRSFGGDSTVLGRSVSLDDLPYTVVGVMPRGFHFPDRTSEYWTALQIVSPWGDDRDNNFLKVVARLRDGVSLETARAEMTQVAAQLEAAYPVENEKTRSTVNRLRDEISSQTRLLLVALMGASLAVLLIACTNLANLLLARAVTRRQELAVRCSLGAGRQRLVRQLLTESLVLAGAGGGCGIVLAYAMLPLLGQLVPASLPVGDVVAIDARVLVFALAMTVFTGIAFGVLPAVRAGREAVMNGLRETGRGGGLRAGRARGALVVVEVAASVGLLIGCGLLLRALNEVRTTDPGFQSYGVLTARTWLPSPRYDATAARSDFYSRVLADLEARPDVESAAFTSFLPMVMVGGIWPVDLESQALDRSDPSTASLRFVTPGYFTTMGIRVRRGRDVRDADTRDAMFVAVVSQSFVDRYWPDQDPLGRTFSFAFHERTVVGVVDDVHVRGLERRSEPQVYLSHQQVEDGWLIWYAPKDLAVRVTGNPLPLAPVLRDIVRRVDPTQPVTSVQLLDDIVAADTASRDVQLRVLVTFAMLAFVLAAVGIYGLLSFAATHRAREIGVRVALGAPRSGIVTMFLREGILLGGTGVVVGAGLGYAGGTAIEALLFGVPPLDPLTFAAAAGLGLTMTLVGSLPPALRASAVDPNTVMRDG